MADILLDTNIIIGWLRGNEDITKELLNLRNAGWLICHTPITKAEVYWGLRHREEKTTEAFFAACQSLPVTDEVGEKAGRYLAEYHKSHAVDIADALIAATAYVHKAVLFTLNRRHYPTKDIRFHDAYFAS